MNHILNLFLHINERAHIMNEAMPTSHALYSEIQRRYQKFVYVGKTKSGQPFEATELTKQRKKSYWRDGVYIGQVGKWQKVFDANVKASSEVLL